MPEGGNGNNGRYGENGISERESRSRWERILRMKLMGLRLGLCYYQINTD
jgi:hypothetical protein